MNLMERSALMLEPQENMTLSQFVSLGKLAESLGFPALFRSDHLLPTSARRGIPSTECWTSLAALFAKTEKLKLGTLVSPVGFRNPALLAKMACDLAYYSEDRLILGVGAGWYDAEYRAFGIPFPPASVRIEMLEEALSIIKPVVKEGRAGYRGRHFSVDLEVYPKPSPIHLVVGATSPKTVGVAAKYADEWNFFMMSKSSFLDLKRVYKEKGGNGVVSRMGSFVLGQSREELDRELRVRASRLGYGADLESFRKRLSERGVIVGTEEEFVDGLAEWVDAGVDRFMFQVVDPIDEETLRNLAGVLLNESV